MIGSVHSGKRGHFRSRLLSARRRPGELFAGVGDFTSIPTRELPGDMRYMGLASTSGGFAALAGSSETAYLAEFDSGFRQIGWHELAGASDPHGLLIEQDHLWVVSSGSNELIRYAISTSGLGEPEIVFRHPGSDPQHFNGIARHCGKLILSAFGVSADGARRLSSTGYLVDVETGARIRSELRQPHSPLVDGGDLLLCESQPSIVWRSGDLLARLDGYLRGLAVAEDGLVHVAESVSRPPRELLTDDRPDAAIWTLDQKGSVLSHIFLTGLGAEIYDLLVLPNRR